MLQKLVDMWDADQQHFVVQDQVLTLEMEDIYFFMGLSHRGATVVLVGGKRDGAKWVDDYMARYYHLDMKKSRNNLPISQVVDFTLGTILLTITLATGSTGSHLDSRSQVDYAVMILVPYNI
jgi:hypothetical protein